MNAPAHAVELRALAICNAECRAAGFVEYERDMVRFRDVSGYDHYIARAEAELAAIAAYEAEHSGYPVDEFSLYAAIAEYLATMAKAGWRMVKDDTP